MEFQRSGGKVYENSEEAYGDLASRERVDLARGETEEIEQEEEKGDLDRLMDRLFIGQRRRIDQRNRTRQGEWCEGDYPLMLVRRRRMSDGYEGSTVRAFEVEEQHRKKHRTLAANGIYVGFDPDINFPRRESGSTTSCLCRAFHSQCTHAYLILPLSFGDIAGGERGQNDIESELEREKVGVESVLPTLQTFRHLQDVYTPTFRHTAVDRGANETK